MDSTNNSGIDDAETFSLIVVNLTGSETQVEGLKASTPLSGLRRLLRAEFNVQHFSLIVGDEILAGDARTMLELGLTDPGVQVTLIPNVSHLEALEVLNENAGFAQWRWADSSWGSILPLLGRAWSPEKRWPETITDLQDLLGTNSATRPVCMKLHSKIMRRPVIVTDSSVAHAIRRLGRLLGTVE
eukprot:TRINITY_DN55640_c0_g1_i1.p1 TRINITY_DN55640_c0_g1~~TRINITY_DN55640_c0_g1_i1.p1  ORF type:complete len:186 (-),score=17.21 TRINITY_DN55640_c0_g1_i1:122-679(-)